MHTHLKKSLCLLVISLLISIGFSTMSDAGSIDTYRIQLRSFDLSPAADLSYLSDKAADDERDRSIEYVQFWEIPDTALRKKLAKEGIELLRYVSGNAYFASIPHGVSFEPETLDAIRWTGPVAADDKLHPRILEGRFAPWSSAGGDQRFLVVQFHPNKDAFEASSLVQHFGGEVLSTVETMNAVLVRLPVEAIGTISQHESVQWIEEPLPPMSAVNSEARTAMNVDPLQEAPYDLDGDGVQVLVYDAGMVEATHEDFGDRVIFTDEGSTHYHATHVAGTIAGDGSRSEASGGTPFQWRGMATAAEIVSYEFCCTYGGGGWLYTDPGDIEEKYNEAINVHGADLANNSIGTNTAPNGYDCDWEGDYGATAILIDSIVRGSLGTPFRIVWSAGNERGSGRCGTTYHTTAPPANAKNHICVGAANSTDDSMTDFSSWGPTDDGRLKPDVSGPGCQEGGDGGTTSTYPGNGYSALCGTSMSGPAVAGTVALLVQDWRTQFETEIDPLPSTVKALLVHDAEDHGNTGPDYQYGYGIVQAKGSIDRLRSASLVEDEIDQGETNTYYLIVQDGDSSLRASLVWDDVPGTANADPVLVNDLDLVVTDPEGTRHYPWTLDPANPDNPAVRTAEDHKNNIEQVYVDAPLEGLWTISVAGTAVPEGPQTHSVVFTPTYTGVSSFGVVSFDAALYACEATVGVLVSDLDLLGMGQVDVSITTSVGDAETLTLFETVADTGIFEATIPLTEGAAFPGDGVLQGADSQTLGVLYIDADDGMGGVNVSKTDTATVDCVGPVISAVAAADLTTTNASVTWLTDENADSTVYYGDSIPPSLSAQSPGMMTGHSVGLEDLAEATRYYFSVESTDPAGNTTLDDKGGAYYSFVTPFYIDSFTDDMEAGAGDWTHAGSGDEWELGTPTYASGPSAAHSGDNCWGTDLDNTYENSVDASLVTGTINVTEGALLTFWHWTHFESCCDQGMVEVSDDGGATWTNITPGGEYNSSTGDWTYVEIDMAGFSGDVMVRFRYTSDGSVIYAGWYIDDVEVKKLASYGVYYYDDATSDALPGGDGDGYAEPGETVDAAVTLMGLTEETALGVTATLTTIDPYATILQDTVAYGDIEPGTQAPGSGPFSIAIDPACPVGSAIKISVEAEASNGGPWWSEFTLRVFSVSTLGGTVSDLDTGVGIVGATVFYNGPASGQIDTNGSGEYFITGLESGTYLLHAEASGYAVSDDLSVPLPPDAEGVDFALGAPEIEFVPASLQVTVAAGSTDERVLQLNNNGNVPLLFQSLEEEGKGAGGPDAFGYRWKDSDEPGGPEYDWIEISMIGTEITGIGDDTNVGPFDMGFDFPYYDVLYDSFRFCTNGWISFTSSTTTYSNTALPSTGAPFNMIAAFWDDLNFNDGGAAYYWSDGDKLVIQYDGVPHYSTGGPCTFEIILESNGRITLQYESLSTPLNELTVGIQNATGTVGLQVAYNASYLHDELAVRIASDVAWLDVDPDEGEVDAFGNLPLLVSFDATGLTDGVYEAVLLFSTNDPLNPEVTVPVTMTIGACEDLDEDGYAAVWCGGNDCDDTNADVNPGADESPHGSAACNDGVDNDCDGLVDDADPDCDIVCTDNDGDGYAVEGGECGEVDCDDSDAEVNPGHKEVRNNEIDDDCDGKVDEACFIGTVMM